MGFGWYVLKMVVSLAFDIADFFLGRIPVFGTLFDIAGGFLGLILWGTRGGLQFLEVIDVTDQIDGFVPTLTLAGLSKIREAWE